MKWWFGRKSASVGASPFAPSWLVNGEAGTLARSYEAQYREVFVTNPVGLRSVKLVADTIGELPLLGSDRALAVIRRGAAMERMAAAVLLHGNAFAQLIVDDREEPRELALLRPERVRIVPDGFGQPEALTYRVGGKDVRIAMIDALYRQRVAHIRSLNPGDDHYGLGCLDAAIGAASVHNRATLWNKSLLDNAARPSGALTYEPSDGANLSGEQFDRLREELDVMFSGSANAGRPMLLDGGLRWQTLAMSPADMDFVALKESAARDIALAFGVPPVLVGLPGDATYANAREAGRALMRQTVIPLARKILRSLEGMLADWGETVKLDIDLDLVGELADERSTLWEQVGKADFLTREEKRVQLGFDPEIDHG